MKNVDDDTGTQPTRDKAYAVPRRFDIATMLTVTVAYAVLFGLMRSIGAPPDGILVVAGMVTWVGLAQALLFGGKQPRSASVVAGMVYVVAWFEITTDPRFVTAANVLLLAYMGSVTGAVVGNFAGSFVAGVFLVSDLARRCIARRSG